MTEIWRDVVGYEGYYQVSNKKEVRSVDRYVTSKSGWTRLQKGKVLAQPLRGSDYPSVNLCKNGIVEQKYVHYLVACAFPEICGEKVEGWEVNHKNEVKTDNRPENLEWIPHIDNMNHGTRNKRAGDKLSGREGMNKKTVVAYENGVKVKEFESVLTAAEYFNLNEGTIRCCIYGRINLIKGKYTFEYADGSGKYSEERLRELKDRENKSKRDKYIDSKKRKNEKNRVQAS